MWKKLISLLLVATLAWTAWAQEEIPPDGAIADSEVAAADEVDEQGNEPGSDLDDEPGSGSAEIEDAAVEEEDVSVLDTAFEELDLDEQTYEEDEDDFVPTEEIPADEPIPFPSNI